MGVPDMNFDKNTFNNDLAKSATTTSPGLVKQAVAVVNSATAPGGAYVQAEAVAVVTKLNELLTALRAAGIIAP